MKILNCLLCTALIQTTSQSYATNESGQINFVGAIYSGDCEVSVEVNNAIANIITLDAIDVRTLDMSGSNAKQFNIVVQRCTGKSTFEIALTGDWMTDNGVVQALDFNSATAVDNLGFQVKAAIQAEGNNTPQSVNWKDTSLTQTVSTPLDDENARYIFPFSVDYYYNGLQENKAKTIGTVKASVNYLISYQ